MKYIQTDNLTIIDYGDGSGKLQIYNKTKSPYGYNQTFKRNYVQLRTKTSRQGVFYF